MDERKDGIVPQVSAVVDVVNSERKFSGKVKLLREFKANSQGKPFSEHRKFGKRGRKSYSLRSFLFPENGEGFEASGFSNRCAYKGRPSRLKNSIYVVPAEILNIV